MVFAEAERPVFAFGGADPWIDPLTGHPAKARRSAAILASASKIGEADRVANIAFSLSAATASSLISILAAAKGVPVVAAVWGALAVGFVIRAAYGYKRR